MPKCGKLPLSLFNTSWQEKKASVGWSRLVHVVEDRESRHTVPKSPRLLGNKFALDPNAEISHKRAKTSGTFFFGIALDNTGQGDISFVF